MVAKKTTKTTNPIIPHNNFVYDAIVVEVLDGDTVKVDLDLGMDIWNHGVKLRLAAINCPEHDCDAGVAAKNYMISLFKPGDKTRIETVLDKTEKYGRYLAKMYHETLTTSVNDDLVAKGYAKTWNGEGVKPV